LVEKTFWILSKNYPGKRARSDLLSQSR